MEFFSLDLLEVTHSKIIHQLLSNKSTLRKIRGIDRTDNLVDNRGKKADWMNFKCFELWIFSKMRLLCSLQVRSDIIRTHQGSTDGHCRPMERLQPVLLALLQLIARAIVKKINLRALSGCHKTDNYRLSECNFRCADDTNCISQCARGLASCQGSTDRESRDHGNLQNLDRIVSRTRKIGIFRTNGP